MRDFSIVRKKKVIVDQCISGLLNESLSNLATLSHQDDHMFLSCTVIKPFVTPVACVGRGCFTCDGT